MTPIDIRFLMKMMKIFRFRIVKKIPDNAAFFQKYMASSALAANATFVVADVNKEVLLKD